MKNKIKKVTLLGNGSKGLSASILEYRKSSDGFQVPSENNKKQKIAVPSNLMADFRKLRYYLLETTERIPDSWKEISLFVNGEFDHGKKLTGDNQKRLWAECQDLLDRTFIDSIETNDTDGATAYKIVGRIASKDSGYISKTESPLITDEHSTIFYREVVDIVGSIFEQTLTFLYGTGLSVKEATIHQMIEEDSSVADLTEEEQLAKAAALLEKRGCFVIPNDEDTAKAISGGNAVTDADDDEFGQVDLKDTIYDHTAGEDAFTEFEEVDDATSSDESANDIVEENDAESNENFEE